MASTCFLITHLQLNVWIAAERNGCNMHLTLAKVSTCTSPTAVQSAGVIAFGELMGLYIKVVEAVILWHKGNMSFVSITEEGGGITSQNVTFKPMLYLFMSYKIKELEGTQKVIYSNPLLSQEILLAFLLVVISYLHEPF